MKTLFLEILLKLPALLFFYKFFLEEAITYYQEHRIFRQSVTITQQIFLNTIAKTIFFNQLDSNLKFEDFCLLHSEITSRVRNFL